MLAFLYDNNILQRDTKQQKNKKDGHMRTWNIHNRGENVIYRDQSRVVELLLQLKN